jgi:hypothetical protein
VTLSTTAPEGLFSELFGFSKTNTDVADAFYSYLTPSTVVASAVASLGPNAVAINGRTFAADTSFEPYRREAFRHRTIPAQRQSINLTNIAGEGTVNTEGLWRREQIDWSQGAGQLFLDRKTESIEYRYYKSKGVDPFNSPNQLTLLKDTYKRYNISSSGNNLLMSRSGTNVFIVDGTTVKSTSDWTSYTTYTWNTTGYTTPTSIRGIATNETYVFLATDTGIWYYQVGNGTTFYGFAKPDVALTTTSSGSQTLTTGNSTFNTATNGTVGWPTNGQFSFASGGTTYVASYNGTTANSFLNVSLASGSVTVSSGTTLTEYASHFSTSTGYDNVFWANDQVLACSGARLYAFQPTHVTWPLGGTPTIGSAPGTNDVLYTHANPYWAWSDAVGGETQIYVAGYATQGGKSFSGCVYRVSLTTNSAGVIQPWTLNTPVQALPMSPDEYPTCLASYLNFVFIGTNKGIRMAQTLSVYDPTATATGDLKSGPLIPNLLQPVTYPVRSIVGDGRFVWFGWSNYDNTSTGLGKLDLSNFINGDPLTPVYSSDLMATTQGEVTFVDWDPITQTPFFAVKGVGIYSQHPTKFVASGSMESGIFSYGVPDPKIPVFFDYNAIVPSGCSVSAAVQIDPNDPDYSGPVALPAITSSSANEITFPSGYRAEQFSTTMTLTSNTTQLATPIMYRWTLKAWPAVVSETQISVVLQLFSVNVVDGQEVWVDPYDSFIFLENLRRSQQIVTYQEGPLTAQVIVDGIDWIPHKRRGGYENGFEGDCVAFLKTIGGYVYNPVPNY